MYPHTIIFIVLILIAVISRTTKPSKVSGLLWLWIIFGVFISLYEFFIICNRQKVKPIQRYWSNDAYQPFQTAVWMDGWREYSTGVDKRYFEAQNPVYVFEGINAFVGVCLLVFLVCCSNNRIFKALLVLQAFNTMLYFFTIPKVQPKAKHQFIYLGISALWIAIPLWLALSG